MPLHYRRILFSHDCDPWYGCPPPPAPPFFTPSPSPSPSSPPPITSPPPWTTSPFFLNPFVDLAPSPSPVHDGGGGWRDHGGAYDYGPVGGVADDHRRRFITYVLSAAAALAFLSLILLGVSFAVRRRQLRRRRQALLAQAPAAATNVGNDDPEAGGGGVVHHVWYIRTVGLDEAAIDSIAVTPYRAGAGLLGAADCSVCLGEFNDGELVRLLPKCGHAFHVPCIDTWLRAHVNCPLCRSDVIDPAATAAGVGIESNPPADPEVSANAAAEQAAAASDSTLEHEDEEEGQEAPGVEDEQQPSSPEPEQEPLPQFPGPLPRNVRRAASMNAAMVSTAADVAALDRLPDAAPDGEEQNGREKHQSGATGHPSTERPASGGLPRSFFARHCRARSSVLPL